MQQTKPKITANQNSPSNSPTVFPSKAGIHKPPSFNAKSWSVSSANQRYRESPYCQPRVGQKPGGKRFPQHPPHASAKALLTVHGGRLRWAKKNSLILHSNTFFADPSPRAPWPGAFSRPELWCQPRVCGTKVGLYREEVASMPSDEVSKV